jgi:hypothetical protein
MRCSSIRHQERDGQRQITGFSWYSDGLQNCSSDEERLATERNLADFSFGKIHSGALEHLQEVPGTLPW